MQLFLTVLIGLLETVILTSEGVDASPCLNYSHLSPTQSVYDRKYTPEI